MKTKLFESVFEKFAAARDRSKEVGSAVAGWAEKHPGPIGGAGIVAVVFEWVCFGTAWVLALCAVAAVVASCRGKWVAEPSAWALPIIAIVLTVFILFPHKVRERIEAVSLYLNWPSDDAGLILLETPQVFTRGRLVNDRSVESEWLRKQLERTETLIKEKAFAGPDAIKFARENLSLAVGAGAASPDVSTETESARKRFVELGLSATPVEVFNEATQYRDMIRNSLMSTVLDDRHDIEGNTVYRFNFNATVVPPSGSGFLAVVEAELSETGELTKEESEKELQRTYFEILNDWRDELNVLAKKAFEDRSKQIESGQDLDEAETVNLEHWIDEEVRQTLEGLKISPEAQPEIIEGFLTRRGEFQRKEYERDIEAQVNAQLSKYSSFARGGARQSGAERGNVQSLGDLVKSAKDQCGTYPAGSMVQVGNVPVPLGPGIMGLPTVTCPSRVSTMKANLDLLFAVRAVVSRKRATTPECLAPKNFGLFLDRLVTLEPRQKESCLRGEDSVAYGKGPYIARSDANPASQDERMNQIAETLTRYRKGILAEYIVKNLLTRLPGARLQENDETTGEEGSSANRLATFFEVDEKHARTWKGNKKNRTDESDARPTEFGMQCVLKHCLPALRLKESDNGTINASELTRKLIAWLHYRTTVFTYAVMPNQPIQQRIEVKRASATSVSAASKGELRIPLSVAETATSEISGFEKNPKILGFGDWGSANPNRASAEGPHARTRFGWVMFPTLAPDGTSVMRHVSQRYAVSALVSLPGWWKRAHLSVWTCWLSESNVRERLHARSICPRQSSRLHDVVLKIPGMASELMQNLRFEVVQFPYLDSGPKSAEKVEVGREANIVVRGGRLWRSPIVRLGMQQADYVEVLPDMKGIVAHFKCIRPAPGKVGSLIGVPLEVTARGFEKVQEDLYVITSEGMTKTGLPVYMEPFTPREGEFTLGEKAILLPHPKSKDGKLVKTNVIDRELSIKPCFKDDGKKSNTP